jgi:hypothetical protein
LLRAGLTERSNRTSAPQFSFEGSESSGVSLNLFLSVLPASGSLARDAPNGGRRHAMTNIL